MSDTIFDTARLRARRLQPGDLDAMSAVYGDADAMRWVGDGTPIGWDDCVKWLELTAASGRVAPEPRRQRHAGVRMACRRRLAALGP
jgi:hypothetical protein